LESAHEASEPGFSLYEWPGDGGRPEVDAAMTREDRESANERVSVALCTYNGAPYLREQLESIASQSLLPYEVVVCDDNSTDASLEILREFKETVPFRMTIYRNAERLGPTKNFERAIGLCNGSIIALADQDDVWLPSKLEKLVRVLQRDTEAGYAFSNAVVVDERLHPLGYTMWHTVSFTKRQRGAFKEGKQVEVLVKHTVVTGATMAFRSSLRELVLPIPETWVHDAWISLIATAAGRNGIPVEEPLVLYRQHPGQAIGGRKISLPEQLRRSVAAGTSSYARETARFRQALVRLSERSFSRGEASALIEAKIRHLLARQSLYDVPLRERLSIVFREMRTGRYRRLSNGWRGAIKDLSLILVQTRRSAKEPLRE